MKILLLLLFISTASFAQTWHVTPEGFKYGDEDYQVAEFKDASAAVLYDRVLAYLHRQYKNPDAALSTIEDTQITVNGFEANAVPRSKGGNVFDLDYTYTIRFKDGKVRIDAPSLEMTTLRTSDYKRLDLVTNDTGGFLTGNYGIYKNGKLKSELAKETLETLFSFRFIGLLSAALNESPVTESSDW
ncbi:DUF4468 domain-containing protein [Leeuwenhoekiella sp. ZYFB001]|uniref:DUF4468 domain-containing protein n=1 Tax=Leeuwenhoekiella sp. ZYFB001 TaxID=2719912 RepID=UPI001431769A|nr:DUF4468 domain-containing protein [Leeuwenhoekiella sp. ZYFB001]